MASRRTLALIAVLALSLSLAGCLDALDDQDRAEELSSGAVDAMEEVDSYTVTITTETTVDAPDAEGTQTTEQELVMRVDQANRRLAMEQTVQQGDASQTVEAYLIDDTMYVQQVGTWQSQELSEDPWEGPGAQQSDELSLLQDGDVTHAGNDTVDGVDVEVLEVEMDGDEYEEFLQEQASDAGVDALGQILELVEIDSVTSRQYVAAEAPHYVHRVETDVSMSMMGEEADISSVATFDDFEEDVTVEVPDEIE